VKPGEACESIAADYGISPPDFFGWNPKVKSDCSGLWAEAYACLGVVRTFNFDDGTNNRWTVIDGSYDIKSNALVGDSSRGGKAVLPAPFTISSTKSRLNYSLQTGMPVSYSALLTLVWERTTIEATMLVFQLPRVVFSFLAAPINPGHSLAEFRLLSKLIRRIS